MRRPLDTSVQTLRGVAALLVVAFHVRNIAPSEGFHFGADDTWSWAIDVLTVVRMPLFAFLAGFVYAARPLRSDYPAFVRGKLRRLLLPMLVVGTVCAVVVPASGPLTHTPWYLWHIEPVRQLWFVESICWVFLLIGLLDLGRLLDRLWVVALLLVGGVAADSLLPLSNDLLGARYAVYLLPFFLAGLAASRFDWRGAGRTWTIVLGAASALVLGSTLLGVWGDIEPISRPHDPIVSAAGVGACLLLIRTRWSSPALTRIGGFSFSIYLMHIAAIVVVLDVAQRAGLSSPALAMLIGLVGGVGLSLIVELVARRSRWTRLLVLGKRLDAPRRAGRHLQPGPANALTRP